MQLKVLEIISLGYVAGGAENIVSKMVSPFHDRGFTLKTLASDLGEGKPHFNEFTFKHINRSLPLRIILTLFNPSSFLALRKALREFHPDIVHMHTIHQVTPSVLFLLKNYPTILTLHGPEVFLSKLVIWCLKPANFKRLSYEKKDLTFVGKLTYFFLHSIQRPWYKFAFKNVDLFIAPSKYLQEAARSDVSPIIHVPNFIEPRSYTPLVQQYNVLFVGRLEKIKGVEFLIQAMATLIQAFPQITLTIIGDGSEKASLMQLTDRLCLSHHIRFLGWIENKELDAYYQYASVVVVPSICPENFPTVCNEAMSAGRPVIGTGLGGIPEIIDDGVNGFQVEPGNAEQLAARITQLFSDETLLQSMGKNALLKAHSLGVDSYVESIASIYLNLLGTYASAHRQGRDQKLC